MWWLVLWPLVGLLLSIRIAPWGHRWFVDWIPPSRPSSEVVGTCCMAVLYAIAWPALLWLWWRRGRNA